MRGLGTIVNVATVLAGTGVGVMAGRFVPERLRQTLLDALALVVLALGVINAMATDNAVPRRGAGDRRGAGRVGAH